MKADDTLAHIKTVIASREHIPNLDKAVVTFIAKKSLSEILLLHVDSAIAKNGALHCARYKSKFEESMQSLQPRHQGEFDGQSWKEHLKPKGTLHDLRVATKPSLATINITSFFSTNETSPPGPTDYNQVN